MTDRAGLSATLTHHHRGITQVYVVGELDLDTRDEWRRSVGRQPAEDVSALIVDVSRVSFCSVGGARMLLELQNGANAEGVPVELVVGSKPVRRCLQACQMWELFSTHACHESALARLGESGVSRRPV
ncbi:STAS domain-containing protein [Amycolatopsis sp. K13G38]|uniref:STAS domain-containing protein n=1 Tax=Amycolatopsis acididurans TaxID=2724524 RepID=A0ABX1J3X0_9PSEU|nr:STAS domain-containing protein [Amycolatopsis acididurans]NKQ54492.1 STAS domain-containing protein [Amycolatopsis acididurans]